MTSVSSSTGSRVDSTAVVGNADIHELLTGDTIVSNSSLGRMYKVQLRRVRELMARLEEIDPEWLAEWESKEKGRSRHT